MRRVHFKRIHDETRKGDNDAGALKLRGARIYTCAEQTANGVYLTLRLE